MQYKRKAERISFCTAEVQPILCKDSECFFVSVNFSREIFMLASFFGTLTSQKFLLLSLEVFEEVFFCRGEFVLGALLELVVFFVCLFLCQLCGIYMSGDGRLVSLKKFRHLVCREPHSVVLQPDLYLRFAIGRLYNTILYIVPVGGIKMEII